MSKVKICGLRRFEDVEIVNSLLPDYIGFVFAESHRRLDKAEAAALKEKLDSKILAVGVFVNQEVGYIAEMCKAKIIDIVQLHGDEDDEFVRRVRRRCDCPIIKSVPVAKSMPPLPTEPDYVLFDSKSPQRGGAGFGFNRNILKGNTLPQYFLAGGLTPENVSDAVSQLHPFCVDVSSGVEVGGFKDLNKVRRFMQAVERVK
jgi:phosphoribosylanthranilate isomerase